MHAPEASIIVVDNASSDRTAERVLPVPLIANSTNRGFAGAVNQGVSQIPPTDLVLLVNPDAELLTPIGPLIEACVLNGLAAGKLVGENGKAQKGFTIRRFPTSASLIFELLGINRLWPGNPVNRRYRYFDRDLEQTGPVEQPAGAFLMFRRDVWEKLGGFDERFFPIWFEDVDFCRRAAIHGFGIEYVPSVCARHAGGHSVNLLSSKARATHWCVSLLRYAAKHCPPLMFRATCLAVVFGSIPRMVLAAVQIKREDANQNLRPSGSYLKIISFASQCFWSPERAWRAL